MRLFIAVLFQQEIQENLIKIIERLKSEMASGNLTRKENLHLTLAFLGETNRIAEVKKAMDEVSSSPFSLEFASLGAFRRDGGDIYWIGVQKNQTLSDIHRQLYQNLIKRGFSLEDRPFRPHLTLGRQMVFSEQFDRRNFMVPKLHQQVSEIVLMKSERIRGKLTYTPIYRKPL